MIKFTREEKIVLIFLTVSLFAGGAVFHCKNKNPAFERFISIEKDSPALLKKININIASKENLTEIKGIGGVLAERIVIYRATHGRFESPEEIKNVKGIGPRKFHIIKEQITVE